MISSSDMVFVDFVFREKARELIDELYRKEEALGIRNRIEFFSGGRPFPHTSQESLAQYAKSEDSYFRGMIRNCYFKDIQNASDRADLISIRMKLRETYMTCWSETLENIRKSAHFEEFASEFMPGSVGVILFLIAIIFMHVSGYRLFNLQLILGAGLVGGASYVLLSLWRGMLLKEAIANLNKALSATPNAPEKDLFSNREAMTGERDIEFESYLFVNGLI
ncbi:hypothetical protein [Paramagnetospirillum magneticum]|uniref:hypothetical protein n=1 Tax=Paramagnetospirillum magneticum TaxID=84159 RepID=UPI0011D0E2F7|nr:hypothetical protein [Paramagnetospirillum magneticum]